jgi:hypothetical protein
LLDLIKNAKVSLNTDDVKLYLKENYYGSESFDKQSFFFITHRSEVAGCAYLNKILGENNAIEWKIEFLLVNKRHLNKGVEQALITHCIKRAKEVSNDSAKTLGLDLRTSNVDEKIIDFMLFK